MNRLYPALFALALGMMAAFPVAAQPAAKASLTEESIRTFYQQSADVIKKPYAEYLKFLKDAMTDDYIVVSRTKVMFPGAPPIKNTETQNKSMLLESAPVAHKSSKNARIATEIKKIELTPGGAFAKVTSITTIRNMIITVKAGKDFIADSHVECRDEVVLSPKDLIQTSKSVCDLEITLNPGQSL
jgi:hypothetical protein